MDNVPDKGGLSIGERRYLEGVGVGEEDVNIWMKVLAIWSDPRWKDSVDRAVNIEKMNERRRLMSLTPYMKTGDIPLFSDYDMQRMIDSQKFVGTSGFDARLADLRDMRTRAIQNADNAFTMEEIDDMLTGRLTYKGMVNRKAAVGIAEGEVYLIDRDIENTENLKSHYERLVNIVNKGGRISTSNRMVLNKLWAFQQRPSVTSLEYVHGGEEYARLDGEEMQHAFMELNEYEQKGFLEELQSLRGEELANITEALESNISRQNSVLEDMIAEEEAKLQAVMETQGYGIEDIESEV